jgi:hypothetical protein
MASSHMSPPTDKHFIVNPPDSDYSATSVPLHNLCANCQRFNRECTLLDFFKKDDWEFGKNSYLSHYDLCVVSELVWSASYCHLCRLILVSSLGNNTEETRYADDRVQLILHAEPEFERIVVTVVVGTDTTACGTGLNIFPLRGGDSSDLSRVSLSDYAPQLQYS